MVILTLIAFVLLLFGTYLLSRHLYVWDGGLFVALALLTFLGMMIRRHGLGRRLIAHARHAIPKRRDGWIRVGVFLVTVLVAYRARSLPADHDFSGLLILWVLALVGFAVSVGGPLVTQARDGWLTLSERERWGLVGLIIAAALLRFSALGRIPANLGGDEGTQLLAGLELVAPRMGNPFATGWYSVPTMSFLAYGLGMRVFGATVAGGRALSAVAGTLTVVATLALGRSLGGRRLGWTAAVFVAVSSYHIHYSRLASNQIFDPLIGAITLWLLWSALSPERPSGRELGGDRRSTAFALAGLMAGLGWYTYFGARWVTFLVGLVVIWRAWAERGLLRRRWRGLLLFGLGWLVAVLPLLGWYSAHPSALSERYNAVSIFASGWLAREVEITGRSAARLLLQQTWRSLTAFHLTPDPTFWYRPGRPLVDYITGALMLLGIIESLVHIKWPSRTLVNLWFVSTLVMAWVLTENPPSSQRGLLLILPVAVYAGWGIELLRRRVASLGPLASRVLRGILLVAVVVSNVVFYFFVYTPKRAYGNPTAESATAFARYTLDNPEPVCSQSDSGACRGRIYLLGPPWLYWEFGSIAFMLRAFPGESVPQDVVPDDVSTPARFACVPERVEQLEMVRELYPGGTEVELRAPGGRLLMWVYDWIPESG